MMLAFIKNFVRCQKRLSIKLGQDRILKLKVFRTQEEHPLKEWLKCKIWMILKKTKEFLFFLKQAF